MTAHERRRSSLAREVIADSSWSGSQATSDPTTAGIDAPARTGGMASCDRSPRSEDAFTSADESATVDVGARGLFRAAKSRR